MNPETYLLIGNIIVWLGIGLYAAYIAQRQGALERRLGQLEQIDD